MLLKNVLSSKGTKLSLKSISFKVTDKGMGVIVGWGEGWGERVMVGVMGGCIMLLKNVLSCRGAKLSLKSISFKVTLDGIGVNGGVMGVRVGVNAGEGVGVNWGVLGVKGWG